MSIFSLKNKTAIITGGGSGIGKAISEVFAQNGAFVCIIDFNEENAKQTLDTIVAKGGKGIWKKCDVSNQKQVQSVIKEIASSPLGAELFITEGLTKWPFTVASSISFPTVKIISLAGMVPNMLLVFQSGVAMG